MKEQLILFKTAKLAKKKGYNLEIFSLRNNYYNSKGELNGDVTDYLRAKFNKDNVDNLRPIIAPTQSLLQKWLREEHKTNLYITPSNKEGVLKWDCQIQPTDRTINGVFYSQWVKVNANSYEEALEKGLVAALKI